ncbi:uncharacterized protein LOC127103651 [Lathyrus oleraceus]|uniref:uncharacterized protein LOC127103651 n=1 Tax=Pisum sativum TaxID=3888 RepID=UPI0021CE1A43|nr:uncharacterized protein LOC127103651 [Pisum sativum]
MAQITMFVCTLIILFPLFFVVTNGAFHHGVFRIPCVENSDCPEKTLPLVMKCIDRHCQYRMIAED